MISLNEKAVILNKLEDFESQRLMLHWDKPEKIDEIIYIDLEKSF